MCTSKPFLDNSFAAAQQDIPPPQMATFLEDVDIKHDSRFPTTFLAGDGLKWQHNLQHQLRDRQQFQLLTSIKGNFSL